MILVKQDPHGELSLPSSGQVEKEMTFRSNLKKKLAQMAVKALKMKPDSVAKKLGISRATVYRYLKK